VISQSIAGTSQSALGQLPKANVMSQVVRQARKQVNQAPPDPRTVSELVIPDAYQHYNDELFLLSDTGKDDPSRIIIFGRQSHEQWANQVDKLYMDGTFKVRFNL